jgi:hypothetical protein
MAVKLDPCVPGAGNQLWRFSDGDGTIRPVTVGMGLCLVPPPLPPRHPDAMDQHSVVADPLFTDPGRGDYTLSPGSPAFALGFRPIPKIEAPSPVCGRWGRGEEAAGQAVRSCLARFVVPELAPSPEHASKIGREIVALKSDDRLFAGVNHGQARSKTGLQWLAPFNPDWQTAVQSGLPRPTFPNVNFACNVTLLERAYNQTGVPGFLSLENCPVALGGIWRYYVSCDQHGHCIPINGTQSGLQPTWEHALQMIMEHVLHLFVKGALVGVFLVR